MQNFRIFGAETAILSIFQLIFRPSTYLKDLQTLRRRSLFGVSYVCPKNYDFSDRSVSIYTYKTYKKACRNTSLAPDQDFRRLFFERKVRSNKIISNLAILSSFLFVFFDILILLLIPFSILECIKSKPAHFPVGFFVRENLTSRTSTISLSSAQSVTDYLSELLE